MELKRLQSKRKKKRPQPTVVAFFITPQCQPSKGSKQQTQGTSMPWSDLIIVPVSHHSTNWSPRSLCGSLLPMKAPLLWTSTHPPATHLVSLSWLEVAYAPGAQNTITCLNSNLLKLELPWLWRHLQMQCTHRQFLPRKLGFSLTIRD